MYTAFRPVTVNGTGITPFLSLHVNQLGDLLGMVIRQQGGNRIFELVEFLRQTCKQFNQRSDPALLADIQTRISKLEPGEIEFLVRAYTAFFHLVNEAERLEIIRKNQLAEIRETHEHPRKEAIRAAVANLADKGVSAETFKAMINRIDIQPTLTAHPTEARRGSTLFRQGRIAGLLQAFTPDGELPQHSQNRLLTSLLQEIALLMTTDSIRADRLQVGDEVQNSLHYLVHTIWETVPLIYADLTDAIQDYYGETLDMPVFLRFRSWIGGDRDGNPNVTPEVTRQALGRYRRAVLELYAQELDKLWLELSVSQFRVQVAPELLKNIALEATRIQLPQDLQHRYRHEPFRLKISYMMARIKRMLADEADVGYSPQTFEADLRLLGRALEAAGLGHVARHGRLNHLLIRARVFGFHFVALDIRQHSRVHEQAVAELFQKAGVCPDYGNLDEARKCDVLKAELVNPRPLAGCHAEFAEVTGGLLRLFEVIRETREQNPAAIGSYIISMTHEKSDLLEVLLLAKEACLWRMQDQSVESALDVVPLFETVADLARAADLMADLFQDPIYGTHLQARKRFQEIMLGYSDSNKDGGFWAANQALENGIETLAATCREHDVDLRLFHGRGGSVGRGGGRANQAIFALPTSARNGRLRFTEQGEIISFRYSRPEVARRHLEQIVHAMIQTTYDTECDLGCSPQMKATLAELARLSMNAYRALIDDQAFWDWFRTITPIAHIGQIPIASRPISRTSSAMTQFEDLRAIPWVFAWTQTRYNLPGWYGTGKALEQMIAEKPETLEQLQAMWQNWSFFRTVVNNVQLEMARTRLDIAETYHRIGAQNTGNAFHERILADYKAARSALLAITGQQDLLDNYPVIQKSIRLRNPYTDVLNLLQVELMKRWQNAPEEERASMRHTIFYSINGIAAGMQSTG